MSGDDQAIDPPIPTYRDILFPTLQALDRVGGEGSTR